MKTSSTQSIIALILFCLVTCASLAQRPNIKYGNVPKEDLLMTVYPKDSSADAVILSELGTVTYSYHASSGLTIMRTVHRRIKILKKTAYEWATASEMTYRRSSTATEYLTGLKGATYNLVNGAVQVDKLTKDAIFEVKKDEHTTETKFTLPNVQVGSVIEYSYTVTSDFDTNIPSWRFQHSIPTVWSEYKVDIPSFYYFRLITQGYEPFVISSQQPTNFNFVGLEQQSITGTSYDMAVQNATALKEEAYVTTMNDYMTKVEFEIAAFHPPGQPSQNFSITWNDLDKALLGYDNFGGMLRADGRVKEIVAGIKASSPDTLAQIRASLDFIYKNIAWNGNSSLYASDSHKKILEAKTGNTADINLLLVAILKELKLIAGPVILSTRAHGRLLESYVLEKKFNYVIAGVYIGEKVMLLDATSPLCPMGILPERCLNGQGRWLLNNTNNEWISLKATAKNRIGQSGNVTINADGSTTAEFALSYVGYAGIKERQALAKDGEQKYKESLSKKFPNWSIKEVKFDGKDDLNEAFVCTIKADISEGVSVLNDKIYLSPSFGLGFSKNPFVSESRKFPIDFATIQEDFQTININLPEGYELEEKPKSERVNLPENSGYLSFQVLASEGNKLLVMNKLSVQKTLFFAEEYDTIKHFFELAVQKNAQKIVLKKKG